MALLDEVFTRFDALVDACGLEKIKTVGDAVDVFPGLAAYDFPGKTPLRVVNGLAVRCTRGALRLMVYIVSRGPFR